MSSKKSANSYALKKRRKNVPFFRQMSALCGRYLETIINDWKKVLLLIAQPLLIALLVTLITFSMDYLFQPIALQSIGAYGETKQLLFSLVAACIFMGLFNSIQEICSERDIIKREYLANLNLSAYIMSKMTVQLLISLLQGIIFTLVCTIAFGLSETGFYLSNAFWEVSAIVILTIFASSAFGFLISATVKTNGQAMLLTPFVLIIQVLFADVLINISGAIRIISYATITHWSARVMGAIFDVNGILSNVYGTPTERLSPMYATTFGNYMGSMGVLLFMTLVCGVVSMLVLRSVSNDTR